MVNVVCLTFDQSLCPARNILGVITLEQSSPRASYVGFGGTACAPRLVDRAGLESQPMPGLGCGLASSGEPQPPAFQRKPISTLP
jgi:hypothetical protein